uniref:Uncharacterized protein n=1 Tax=Vespula pensylvanica TaxID=30213 RepID=A0A834U914_VESPE|nr:hypothetical protein H0235_008590 [Vespula pensylvanica]
MSIRAKIEFFLARSARHRGGPGQKVYNRDASIRSKTGSLFRTFHPSKRNVLRAAVAAAAVAAAAPAAAAPAEAATTAAAAASAACLSYVSCRPTDGEEEDEEEKYEGEDEEEDEEEGGEEAAALLHEAR